MDNYLSSGTWEPIKDCPENGPLGIQWTAKVGDASPINNSHSNPLNFDLTSSIFTGVKSKVEAALASKDIPGTIFEPIEEVVMGYLKAQVSEWEVKGWSEGNGKRGRCAAARQKGTKHPSITAHYNRKTPRPFSPRKE